MDNARTCRSCMPLAERAARLARVGNRGADADLLPSGMPTLGPH